MGMLKELDLTPRQRATIAAALTLSAAALLVAVFSAVIWGVAHFVASFKNILLPPIVAVILTLLLRPFYDLLLRMVKGIKPAALFLFILSALIPLGLFFWFAGALIVDELVRFFADLPSMINTMLETVKSHWPQAAALMEKYGLLDELGTLIDNPGTLAADAIKSSWQHLSRSVEQIFHSAASLLAWAALPIYFVFFLMAKPFTTRKLEEQLPFLKKKTRKDVIYLIDQFIEILLTFFRGQIVLALAQGVLFATGFALVGLPYGIAIGMVLGLLNIVPYLGNVIGLAVALPMAYFGAGGSVLRLILVLLVFGLVQTIEAYLLTPRIMGSRTGMHPALIIFAVFFWGAALDGVLGMMLAIPLTAFIVVFWRLIKKKYITEIV